MNPLFIFCPLPRIKKSDNMWVFLTSSPGMCPIWDAITFPTETFPKREQIKTFEDIKKLSYFLENIFQLMKNF